MRRRTFLVAAAALLPARAWPQAAAQVAIEAMRFSALQPGAALPAWLKKQSFPSIPRHTEFALVADEGRTVLRARSQAASAGLSRELRVDLRSHPLLAWRWKVMNLLAKSDLTTKAGDDFPARLYVVFGRRALCYVWDSRLPVGTLAPNSYSERVQMVVADSGTALLGRWQARERDVTADYRRGFGGEPPETSGLVVSADTDNTGESAESFFGDIEFRSR
jgi:DUF3047 family protein